ncbi:MAG: peptidase T, partial [Saprospiraceae bacterium]
MFKPSSFPTCAERFIRYARIDTQSDAQSSSYPSTEKQKELSILIHSELQNHGINSETNEYGYVYARIPSNVIKDVPGICFCAHIDTAPDCSGTNV